jgi:flavin reductase (DIM6/NTAB) family NADH-FMN oxidoreductase RutF
MIHIAPGMYEDGLPKDTARNIESTGEFVHNVVTEETLHQMHCSSERLPTEESEFDACGIQKVPSETVSPPRVRDSVISFECSLHRNLDLGSHTLIIGQIEHMAIDESVLNLEEEIDIEKLDAIGRLTAGKYVSIDSQFELESIKSASSTERDGESDD